MGATGTGVTVSVGMEVPVGGMAVGTSVGGSVGAEVAVSGADGVISADWAAGPAVLQAEMTSTSKVKRRKVFFMATLS